MKLAILVLSCDKYSDLWEPYALLFNRFWPDCPYDKYLASNSIEFHSHGFKPILMGPDESWSYGVKVALAQLKGQYDYVFTTLEDCPIKAEVDTALIVKAFDSVMLSGGDFLRTVMLIRPKLMYINQYYGAVENNTPYRQTCVYSLWKIDTLNQILDDKESAWDFERIGVKRGFKFDQFYCVHQNQFNLIHLVVKGKLLRKGVRQLEKLIPEVVLDREKFTITESTKELVRSFVVRMALRIIPKELKNKIYFKRNQ
jgi:hypothetical protein